MINSYRHLRIYTICIILLMLGLTSAYAMRAVEGDGGKVLLLEEKEERRSVLATGVQVRDPFNWPQEVLFQYQEKFAEYAASVFSELVLSGIIWNNEKPLAIIDNRVLSEGDQIREIMVVEINRDSVLLQKGMELYTLEFNEQIIDLGTEMEPVTQDMGDK